MIRITLAVTLLTQLASTKTPPSLEQINKRLRITNGLRVDFNQEVLTLRNKIRRTTGQAFFDARGRFRWIVKQNGQEKRVIIYNGKTIVEYLPTEKIANMWSVASTKTLALTRVVDLVKSLDNLQSSYRITEKQFTTNHLHLTLTPRTKNDIAGVKLTIALTKNFVETVRITYRNKRHNTLTFTNPQRRDFGTKPFSFSPVKGTKVNRID